MIVRKFTKREQYIAFFCALTGFVYLGYLGAYIPFKNEIEAIDAKISTAEAKFNKNRETIKEAEELEAQYKTYISKFAQTKTNEQEMSSLLEEIEEVANKLGLKISDLKPKKVQKEEYYNRFSVTLAIDSQLVDIIHFIYTLENKPYNFSIDEIRFDQATRAKSSVKSNLVLSKILIPR
ncbi:MAG: type 4a pilus biogenesis protein PilO [Candidatus Omnitrophica bacterium]|nr:type 4a pilus biogenesis protein PilO [Candidatus Omnitrophota bacterium]